MAAPMEAEVVVPAAPEAVFDYLARLDNHWRLMDGSVEVLALDGDGEDGPDRAVVRLHGPLGLGRIAHTQVLDAERPSLLRGRASIGHLANGGRVTEGEVTWRITPSDNGGARVRLSASVRCAGLSDRLVLALGGTAWMRTRFDAALARLRQILG
jgi:uncharacterized protein YndB with AHSA1/START domain